MMRLPKGTFKGLARVLAPLSFWMAAGWAAYPYIIKRIMDLVGETINMNEITPFSRIMVIACVAAGISLSFHGFRGKDADEKDIKALARKPVLCPYCGAMLVHGAGHCQGCSHTIPK